MAPGAISVTARRPVPLRSNRFHATHGLLFLRLNEPFSVANGRFRRVQAKGVGRNARRSAPVIAFTATRRPVANGHAVSSRPKGRFRWGCPDAEREVIQMWTQGRTRTGECCREHIADLRMTAAHAGQDYGRVVGATWPEGRTLRMPPVGSKRLTHVRLVGRRGAAGCQLRTGGLITQERDSPLRVGGKAAAFHAAMSRGQSGHHQSAFVRYEIVPA